MRLISAAVETSSGRTAFVHCCGSRKKTHIADAVSGNDACPLCGAKNEAALLEVRRLTELAEDVGRLSSDTSTSTPVLEREVVRTKEDMRRLEEDLDSVRSRRWTLEGHSEELASRRQTINKVLRFAGRVEQALDGYWVARGDSELRNRIAELEAQIRVLRAVANPGRQRAALTAALQRFSQRAAPYVEKLELERARDVVQLDVNDLMLYVVGEDGGRDALWEIGSGANWMGYHVATSLALHEMFLEMAASPVPSFLMIDQPSQAYFPDRWPGDAEELEATSPEADRKRQKDIAGVRRVFEALSLAMDRTRNHLQIVVTDHAGSITWEGISHIHLVGNWRDGQDEFLIPSAWLT